MKGSIKIIIFPLSILTARCGPGHGREWFRVTYPGCTFASSPPPFPERTLARLQMVQVLQQNWKRRPLKTAVFRRRPADRGPTTVRDRYRRRRRTIVKSRQPYHLN